MNLNLNMIPDAVITDSMSKDDHQRTSDLDSKNVELKADQIESTETSLLPQTMPNDASPAKLRNGMQAWSMKHQMLLKINGFSWLWSEHSTRIQLSIKTNLGIGVSSPRTTTT